MTQVPRNMEKKDVLKRKPTLVRRVSDMFKDGNYSGPPMLFRHASMQKIRHCCQNLNLFPFLLYSFDNSKSFPLVRKMRVYLSRLLQGITINFLVTYQNLRHAVLNGLRVDKSISAQAAATARCDREDDKVQAEVKPAARFSRLEKPKRKRVPPYLIAAVYLVPLLLLCQVTVLCSLTILGKYTPGFIFLIGAMLLLGGIAYKILMNNKYQPQPVANGAANQRERKKVQ